MFIAGGPPLFLALQERNRLACIDNLLRGRVSLLKERDLVCTLHSYKYLAPAERKSIPPSHF